MEKREPGWSLAKIAERLGGVAHGPAELQVLRPVVAGQADPSGITFATNAEFLEKAEATSVGAVIVPKGLSSAILPYIEVENARAAFGQLLDLFSRPMQSQAGIHPTAIVDPSATVDPSASIGAFCVVGAETVIGAEAVLHPHCVIAERCVVGPNSVVMPRVVFYPDTRIGARCLIHSGATLGADGFGFEWDGSKRVKIAQIGGVLIGDDVEIGSQTCVDRAMLGDTVIRDGVKIDNLCQIGHNVSIDEHAIITGMVGIGGSAIIGKRVVIGANAGVTDHVTIGDDVVLGGRTGVASNITEPGEYFGQPAQPKRDAIRTFLLLPKLPEIWNRLRAVEKKLENIDKDSE